MPITITVTLYNMEEVREELARRSGKHKPYSRSRVYDLVREYLVEHRYEQGRFFLTDEELAEIVRSKRRPGRPRRAS